MEREQQTVPVKEPYEAPALTEGRPDLIYPTSANIPAIDEADALDMMMEATALDNNLGC